MQQACSRHKNAKIKFKLELAIFLPLSLNVFLRIEKFTFKLLIERKKKTHTCVLLRKNKVTPYSLGVCILVALFGDVKLSKLKIARARVVFHIHKTLAAINLARSSWSAKLCLNFCTPLFGTTPYASTFRHNSAATINLPCYNMLVAIFKIVFYIILFISFEIYYLL